LVPTNFTGPWYQDRRLQVIKEIKSLLVREKRFVGLLIAGIVAATPAIATMTAAAVALSQSIQNAHYVNILTQNVSFAFQQQVAIDEKIDIHLNSREAALLVIGDEVQMLKFHQDLLCCAGFQHIVLLQHLQCHRFPRKLVKAHVMGAWKITMIPLTYKP
jgi:hypothetical protein